MYIHESRTPPLFYTVVAENLNVVDRDRLLLLVVLLLVDVDVIRAAFLC